jgi:ketosteroid isomerase-like protein
MAPLQYKGWAEYESGLKQVLAGFEYLKLTVHDDAAVHRSGEWAWATATWSGDGKMKNGNKLDLEGRWTVIWQRKSGKWLIVHEHVSVPWSPPSEKRER